MAKNKARKNKADSQAKPKAGADADVKNTESTADAVQGEETSSEKKASAEKSSKEVKTKNILYQVKTKRDSGVIKAYITFTYRVLHPTVSARLIIYGLLVMLPGIVFFKDLFWKIFFIAVGAMLILLGLFRQYISLAITKNNDPDYKSGAVFTYDFTESGADFSKNGERFLKLNKYKDITNFYYDDDYYYLAVKSRDFFVIPKAAFTIGDPAEFEEFIYKKSKHTCRWIPDKFSDRMKKRRAQRAVASGGLNGRDLFK